MGEQLQTEHEPNERLIITENIQKLLNEFQINFFRTIRFGEITIFLIFSHFEVSNKRKW